MGRAAKSAGSLNRAWLFGVLAALGAGPARGEGVELQPTLQLASLESAMDPVNWVLAQASTARSTPPPPPPANEPPIPARGLWSLFANDSGSRLQLAPIRWRGNAGLEQRWTTADESGKRNQTIEFVNLDVATYISQPWLAQVRANLGILAYQQRISGDTVVQGSGAVANAERSASLTGGGTLMVFPASRFPFTASFTSSDSRASGEAVASDYVNRMLTLRQTYRSPLGDQVFGASLERSMLMSESFGRDTVTSLSGNMQRTWAEQMLDVNGTWSQNRRTLDGVGSELARLSSHHSWRPDELLSVESFASYSLTDLMAPQATGLRSRFLQANSFATWRPEEDSPLFVTGGLRFADSSFGSSGGESRGRSLGGNAAMSYAFSEAARVVASTSVTTFTGEGSTDVVTTQSVGGNYSPPPVPLGPVSWSWASGVSASNQTGGEDGRQHLLVAQVNHQATSGTQLGSSVGVSGAVNQGFSVLDDSQRGLSRTLNHSISGSLRFNPTSSSDGFVSASLGDSRTQGAREEQFQIANLQINGNLQLGAYSLLSANLTLQATRQRLVLEDERHNFVQRSGTLSYQHGRLFSVPRLRFVATATFNDLALESRLLGDAAAPRDTATRLYEARLQWDIGRLDFRLGTRIATFEGRHDRQVFFRVNRQFGIY